MDKRKNKISIIFAAAVFFLVASIATNILYGWQWASVLLLFCLTTVFLGLTLRMEKGRLGQRYILLYVIFGVSALLDLLAQMIILIDRFKGG